MLIFIALYPVPKCSKKLENVKKIWHFGASLILFEWEENQEKEVVKMKYNLKAIQHFLFIKLYLSQPTVLTYKNSR